MPSEALEKIDPAVHPHVLTFLIGRDKRTAWKELALLGKEAISALPILLAHYRNPPTGQNDPVPFIAKQDWLDTLVKIAPTDPRVVRLLLQEVATTPERPGVHFTRRKAIELLDTIGGERKDKVRAPMTVLNYPGLAPVAIESIERIGQPEAAAAVPLLQKLRFVPEDDVRQAVLKALASLDSNK
jgi:hypothetical protein